MEKNGGGLIVVVLIGLGLFATREYFAKVNKENAQKTEQENKKNQEETLARRLAGQEPSYLLDDPKEDFSITFPDKDKPRETTFHTIGPQGGSDKEWKLTWHENTEYSVRRGDTAKQINDERAYVKSAMKLLIEHEDAFKKGRPIQWIITAQRDLTFQDQYPATEIEYTYKRYTRLEEARGRLLIVKVPETLYYLHVDGKADYVKAPVTDRFFTSFRYAPKEKPPVGLPKKKP